MDKSSMRLAIAAIGGAIAIFLIYTFSGLILGVAPSYVFNTFSRVVLLYLIASTIIWTAGKFVAQYNSGWFLPIIFVGIASIFGAWIALVLASGTRTQTVAGKPPAPRTVKQYETFGQAPPVEPVVNEASIVPSAVPSVDANKVAFEELMGKIEVDEKYKSFDPVLLQE